VAKAPDFSLQYTKGQYPLTFKVKSVGDTTLLIILPDGKWVADDDSGGGFDPLIRLANPQSGRYDIYVGTHRKDPLPATLYITEVDDVKAPPPPVKENLPDCYIIAAGIDNYIHANELNGCLNDARNTVAAFKAQTGVTFRKVEAQTLLDGSATRAAIQQKLQAFTTQGAAHDFMVLFLSGHGGRTNSDRNWYFAPFDFHPNNAAGTMLTDKQILDAGHELVKQKKNVVIIIDACFCGQMHATAKRYLSDYKDPQDGGMVLMLSSAANQTSAALGNYSAFAKAFADAMAGGGDLNKDGKVTLDEIQTYSFTRTAQLLAQSRITDKQDSIVAWSASISKDMPLAYISKVTTDPVRSAPTGRATRWVGTESLSGFGKLTFAMYASGRAIMVDAKETTEGIWRRDGNQFTLSFFDGSVVYNGTLKDGILSGTATSPSVRTNAAKAWTWSVKQ
jgi:Caspase domain